MRTDDGKAVFRFFEVVKRTSLFLLVLLAAACIDGWLLSKLNFVGRFGVDYLHKEYRFLRGWWKGGLLVFTVWAGVVALHQFFSRRLAKKQAITAHAISLALASLGLFATYHDFRTDITHRLIGERFHLGAYLFWIVWMVIAVRAIIVYKPKTSTGL